MFQTSSAPDSSETKEPKFLPFFFLPPPLLLLNVACAKLALVGTWALHTRVLVFWGCRFSLHVGILFAVRTRTFSGSRGTDEHSGQQRFLSDQSVRKRRAKPLRPGTAYLCKSISPKCYCFTASAPRQEFLLKHKRNTDPHQPGYSPHLKTEILPEKRKK